ncbi:MAG: monofunctional biosynthetic peptidoglycan transglycosylase [Candidatus Aminicenantia bacterium]
MRKLIIIFTLIILVVLIFFLSFWFLLPDPSPLKSKNPKLTSLMKYRMKQAEKKGIKYQLHHKWIPLNKISPYLINAVLISEDDRFFNHYGIDWIEMKESVKKDIKKKKFVRGASTISQQVAKNIYLSPQKTIFRKFLEIILALKIEKTLSKKRILEIYLNIAEWGNGIFGAESASLYYFKKNASELSPYESASLASSLPNSLKFSPISDSRILKKRVARILKIMEKRGLIKDYSY